MADPLPDPAQPKEVLRHHFRRQRRASLPAAAMGLLEAAQRELPALASDPSGIRLGSGGGWYDRLRADPAWRDRPALAVLPAACVSATALPRDPWDVPFDGWLDEQGLHRLRTPPDAPAGKVAAS